MKTMQQERAGFALDEVRKLANKPVEFQKEFNANASALPFMVQANGLGQAAAFYRSQKDGSSHRVLYDLLSSWLTGKGQPYAGSENLLDGITREEMSKYMTAQAEALLLLDWVKKFGRAFLALEASSPERADPGGEP